ncbi:MAG: 2-carboxy-1,4-naphthoquinone phytyltransferase [Cyanobacteria bacterium P01_D01_bin.1]
MTTQAVKPDSVCAEPIESSRTRTDTNQLRSQKQLWMAALKPPMYCVAVMPICVGSAVAYTQTRSFQSDVFLTFALSAILILVWENLSNDVFDAATGIDINKHHSLVNLTRNRALIFWIGNACLLLGIAGILTISLRQQDPTVLTLVLACCALGYLYQGPPFRLGYQGLGEVLCFLSFGPLAVGAAYYSQTQRWSDTGWLQSWQFGEALLPAAIMVGVTTTLVLFCSHFHQVEDDLKAGKRSPIARLGTQRGAQLLPVACGAVLLTDLIAIAQGGLPRSTLLIGGALPAAVKLCRHVLAFHDQPDKVKNSKFLAIYFHFWSGVLLMLGLIASTAI